MDGENTEREQQEQQPDGAAKQPDTGDGGQQQPDATFTQAQVDGIIKERLTRHRADALDYAALGYKDRAAAEAALKAAKKLEDEQKTELDRERDARGKAEGELAALTGAYKTRAVKAEARVQAASLGVPAASIPHVLKLAELDGVAVGDDGEPDEAAVKAAIEKVLGEIPALKGAVASGGFNPPPAQGTKSDPVLSAARLAAGLPPEK